jgi:hypothetical protein
MKAPTPPIVWVSLALFLCSMLGPAVINLSLLRLSVGGLIVVAMYLAPVLIFTAVWVVFIVLAYRGRNWARWVHAAIVGTSSLAALFMQPAAPGPPPPLPNVFSTVAWIVVVASVVLLFLPAANRWYRQQRADRTESGPSHA